MKILVDCATPKDVLFFQPIIKELEKHGCEVRVTTREYAENIGLLTAFGMKHEVLGRWGGATLEGKLVAYTERVGALAKYMKEFKPKVVVNTSIPESSRVAFGLNIPLISFIDIPEATHATKLTVPLATKILSPWIIPINEFLKYGLNPEQIYQYRALDPVAWLDKHKVDGHILEKLSLETSKPVIVFRCSETKAAYLKGHTDLATKALEKLPKDEYQLVAVPRYNSHKIIDLQSLLAKCAVLVGGGGTMNMEAAYYGTPVIDCRAVDTFYMRFLRFRGLAVRALTIDEIVSEVEKAVEGGRNSERAKRVFGQMKFPLEEITEIIIGECK